jgi:hypothetical protein
MVGVAAVAAVVTLAFITAVRSPAVGAFVKFVTVVIVPAVIFVVLATVAGNVAARNPVGCVYVAIRLEIVASRLLAVSPVTEPTDPLTDPTLPDRLPVMFAVNAPVTVSAPRVVVPALLPEIKCPPLAPGATLAIYSALPMLEAVVKSPAVASCHTPVAT